VQQQEHTVVEAEIITERPAPVRELSIASFGNLPVRYEPATDFGKEWKAKLPAGASLVILIADAWRDKHVELFNRPGRRQRFGFRDMDEDTGTLLPLPTRGKRCATGEPLQCADRYGLLLQSILCVTGGRHLSKPLTAVDHW
jgi:hypothetical protein